MIANLRSTTRAMGIALLGIVGSTAADDAPPAGENPSKIGLERRLLLCDANRDRTLDRAELEAFALSVHRDDALQTFIGFLVAMGGSADATIDRVTAFDANKDGRVSAGELPERLRVVIEKADASKDGALDSAEIKQLAASAGTLGLPREVLVELNGRGVTATAARVLDLDANGDRKVAREELTAPIRRMFEQADADRDGSLDAPELKALDTAHNRTGLPREFNDLDGRNTDRGGDANLERLRAFDSDGDGKLARAELLERGHNLLDRVDADRDGVLDRAELLAWERREALATLVLVGRRNDVPDQFEQVLRDHASGDSRKKEATAVVEAYRDKVGKLPGEARAKLLQQIEGGLGHRNYQVFQGAVVEALGRRGGGFNGRYIPAARVVERLLTFDADGDGRLSEAEVAAMSPRLASVERVVDAHHLGRRDVVIESSLGRVMAFDANKDGKIARSELPERLHGLLESNDADGDGVLDAAELNRIANEESFARFVQGAAGGVNLALIEQGLRDLDVSSEVQARALAALVTYQASLRDATEQARVELQAKLERVLGSDGLRSLQEALARRAAARVSERRTPG